MDLTRERRNWFTNSERAWLAEWVLEFSTLQGNRKAEGDSTSQMKKFQTRLLNEFDKQFPYRHPRNAKAKGLTSDERGLVCDEQEWTSMGQRFRDWLQKRKSGQAKAPQKTSGTPTAETKKRVSFIDSYLSVYAQGGGLLRNAQTALRNVIRESNYSWAEIEPSELESRQGNLSSDMQDVLRLFSHTTGAEFLVVGIWRDAEEWNCTRVSSPRAAAFMREDALDVCSNEFLNFLVDYIGPNLQTDVDLAAPAVQAASAVSVRPKLPPRSTTARRNERAMKEWLSALWAWQGGKLPVPWSVLEADTIEKKRFCLVEKKRLPPGIPGLRCPDDWMEQETDVWFTHCEGSSDPDTTFQFLQPRPGQFEVELRTERYPEAIHIYPPESLAFALRRSRAQQSAPIDREDGLPTVEPNNIYAPFSASFLSDLQCELPADDPYVALAELVNDYEQLGPHAPDLTTWEDEVLSCPHILQEEPPRNAGLEHFNTTDGFLLKEFFLYGSPDAYPYSLGRCVEWVQPVQWYHPGSGTIEGGPYGCKWPILLILHIRINMEWAGKQRFPEYHGKEATVEFLKRDVDQLDGIMGAWLEALRSSREELETTYEVRRGGDRIDIDDVPFERPEFEDVLAWNANEMNDDWSAPGVSILTYEEYKKQHPEKQRNLRKRSAPPQERQTKRAKSESESSTHSTPVGDEEQPVPRRSTRVARATARTTTLVTQSEDEDDGDGESEEEDDDDDDDNEEDQLDEEAGSDEESDEPDADTTLRGPKGGRKRSQGRK